MHRHLLGYGLAVHLKKNLKKKEKNVRGFLFLLFAFLSHSIISNSD